MFDLPYSYFCQLAVQLGISKYYSILGTLTGDSGDDDDIILCVIQLCMNNLGFKLIEWIFL